MNQLGGRVVSMLPCLHSFCAICAAWLFANSSRSPCPVCHANANHREVCTFICDATQSLSFEDVHEKYGSKIHLVIQEIIWIHREFPNDKILLFGSSMILRQMKAAMHRELKHCFLDQPSESVLWDHRTMSFTPTLTYVWWFSHRSHNCQVCHSQWYINTCLPTCKL